MSTNDRGESRPQIHDTLQHVESFLQHYSRPPSHIRGKEINDYLPKDQHVLFRVELLLSSKMVHRMFFRLNVQNILVSPNLRASCGKTYPG